MNKNHEKESIEAATFRRLVAHLQKNTQVQNIDLMNLAGFCRNCLARWYQEVANEKEVEMTKEQAREIFYGMPFNTWRAKYQIAETKKINHGER